MWADPTGSKLHVPPLEGIALLSHRKYPAGGRGAEPTGDRGGQQYQHRQGLRQPGEIARGLLWDWFMASSRLH